MLTEPTPAQREAFTMIEASTPSPRVVKPASASTTKSQVNLESMAYSRRNFGLDLALTRR